MNESTTSDTNTCGAEEAGAEPRDVLLRPTPSPNITSAGRIEQKRKQRRMAHLKRFSHGSMVVAAILWIGLVGYIFTEIGLLKSSSRGEATASVPKEEIEAAYSCFATVGESSLELSLPGKLGSVIAVGFHEAERQTAVAIAPRFECFDRETTTTVRNAVARSQIPVLFIMSSRGRGSAPTSAIDVAMAPNSVVLSPVDGVVTVVKTYNLYGKLTDYHVEIQPDGYPDIRIAIIHIDNVQVTVGQRVGRRDTLIGWQRPLPQIKSQINKYLPEPSDHVHMQVNPATVNADMGS